MNIKHLKYLPATVLILVALLQVTLVLTSDLTAWRGGGFGMFSTSDRAHHRKLVITGYDKQGTVYRVLVKRLALKQLMGDPDVIARIISLPQEKKIEAFGKTLLDWKYTGSGTRQKEVLNELKIDPATHIWFKDQKTEPIKFVRPVQPYEVISKKKKIGSLETVELQMWRLQYDLEQSLFFWIPMNEKIRIENE